MRVPRIGRTSSPGLRVGLGGVAVLVAGGMSLAWLAERVGGIIDGLGGPVPLHPPERADVDPDRLDEAALPAPRAPATGAPATGAPATGAPATGAPATGTPAPRPRGVNAEPSPDRLVQPRRPVDQGVPPLSAQRAGRAEVAPGVARTGAPLVSAPPGAIGGPAEVTLRGRHRRSGR